MSWGTRQFRSAQQSYSPYGAAKTFPFVWLQRHGSLLAACQRHGSLRAGPHVACWLEHSVFTIGGRHPTGRSFGGQLPATAAPGIAGSMSWVWQACQEFFSSP